MVRVGHAVPSPSLLPVDVVEEVSNSVLSVQLLLKSLYITWLSRGEALKPGRLESLVAEILTDLHIPQVNCLPIKKPFGPLKELVLPPIHEEMGAPYTSTAAWWLLRRIGRPAFPLSIPSLSSISIFLNGKLSSFLILPLSTSH